LFSILSLLAAAADGEVTTTIHAALQAKELLPQQHLVNTGYLDAPLPVRGGRR
jgi:transposase